MTQCQDLDYHVLLRTCQDKNKKKLLIAKDVNSRMLMKAQKDMMPSLIGLLLTCLLMKNQKQKEMDGNKIKMIETMEEQLDYDEDIVNSNKTASNDFEPVESNPEFARHMCINVK